MAHDKYTRRQKYISTDGGLTFNPVTPPEYIKGELIETDSVDCGAEVITWVPVEGVYICGNDAPAPITRWITDTGYMCVGYNKYNKEKEQQSTDGGTTWTDTGNTRAGSTLIEANSTDCGYVPPAPTISDCLFTITGVDYTTDSDGRLPYPICVVQEDILTVLEINGFMLRSWSNYKLPEYDNFPTSSDTTSEHQYYYTKYVPEANTVSLAYFVRNTKPCGNSFCKNNVEWNGKKYSTVPYGKILDSDHSHNEKLSKITCDAPPAPITRWITDTGYMCVGYDKYNKEKEQVSYNSGVSWEDTGNTRAGSTLIEANSTDCGYVPTPYSTQYLTTEALGSGNIRLYKGGNSDQPALRNIQYSKNNGSWTAYTYGTNISVSTGDKIRWKATKNVETITYNCYSSFAATTDYKAYGNPLSLLDNYSFVDAPHALHDYAYYKLFINSSRLKDISGLSLPAIGLADGCYNSMFYGCTGLTTVPSNLLPATLLAKRCYYMMFYNCTNLTTAPELPATTLAVWCYNHMFYGCTSLTTAPELPARTLSSAGYQGMFKNCSNLNYIKCLVTSIVGAGDQSLQWVYGVAPTGTFVKPSSMTGWTTGDGGIPEGWTVVDI